jgi:FKBP-type peptidyl-prolyl cis-trans isomerase
MRSIYILALLGVALATVAVVVRSGWLARKNPGTPINSAMRQAQSQEAGPRFSDADAAIIAQQFPAAQKTASGLLYIVHAEGQGPTPAPGASLTVHYEGRFIDGKKFDSSRDRGEPFVFQVGLGRVIKGWDEAFLGMRQGEKRTLIVPYWLGYGPRGQRHMPPAATLVFEVELLSVQ